MLLALIDAETGGLDPEKFGLTELAIALVDSDGSTPLKTICEFKDPGHPLSQEVQDLTGITDEMVAGKVLDIPAFQAILDEAEIVIGMHVTFDRSFVEPLGLHARKWGCAKLQIPWASYGFRSTSQRLLAFEHGLTPSSHRAMGDVWDLWDLLRLSPADRLVQRPATPDGRYLDTLLTNAAQPYYICLAHDAPFNSKEYLKENFFQWSGKPPWYRIHSHAEGGAVRDVLKQAGCADKAVWAKVDPTDPAVLKKYFPQPVKR